MDTLHHLWPRGMLCAFLPIKLVPRVLSKVGITSDSLTWQLSMAWKFCIFHEDKVHADPLFLPKVNSMFHCSQEIMLPSFCPNPSHPRECEWHILDACWAFSFYLYRTTTFGKTKVLFVSYKPHKQGLKESPSTIS